MSEQLDPNKKRLEYLESLRAQNRAMKVKERPRIDEFGLVSVDVRAYTGQTVAHQIEEIMAEFDDIFYIREDGSLAIPQFIFDLAWSNYTASDPGQKKDAFQQRGGFGARELFHYISAEEIRKQYTAYTGEKVSLI